MYRQFGVTISVSVLISAINALTLSPALCATLLKPGGQLFLSTINRNARSFALAIVAAEHLLKLLPKGTHRHAMFIRPSELAAGLRQAGFELRTLEGLQYDPFRRQAWRNSDVGVNYLAHAEKVVAG